MTLNDAVKRVKRESHRGDQTVTTDQTTTDIIACINDARREVIRQLPKNWLRKSGTLSVVASTTTYSLASDVQEPIVFHYTSNSVEYVISKVPSEREFYQKIYSYTAAFSKPLYYLDLGPNSSTGYKQIQIFPTPDASYTVTYAYYKDPTGTDLTTSDLATELPDVPTYLHDAVWKGALYFFLHGFDDPAWERAYRDWQKALVDINASEDSDQDQDVSFRFGNPNSNRDANTYFRLD